MFGDIFKNPAIQKMAFGQLKGLLQGENAASCIVIGLDKTGEVEITTLKGAVTITETIDSKVETLEYGKSTIS